MSRSSLRLLVPALVILLAKGCGLLSRRVKTGEEFTLRPGEKVVVAGTGLGIELDDVGRQWYADRRGEAAYATLTITGRGAGPRSLTVGESESVGDYTVTLVGANPFRAEGGPDCTMMVTRRTLP